MASAYSTQNTLKARPKMLDTRAVKDKEDEQFYKDSKEYKATSDDSFYGIYISNEERELMMKHFDDDASRVLPSPRTIFGDGGTEVQIHNVPKLQGIKRICRPNAHNGLSIMCLGDSRTKKEEHDRHLSQERKVRDCCAIQ